MNSRFDRFEEWRKADAPAERNSFITANEIYRYVNEHSNLAQIDADFSVQFDKFDKMSKRSTGALVFLKFVLDEYLEIIPSDESFAQLRPVIITLRDLFTSLYELPAVAVPTRVDIVANKLLPALREFIGGDNAVFAHIPKHKSAFLVSALYFTIKMIAPSMKNLSWVINQAIFQVVPEAEIHETLESLLNKLKEKETAIAALPSLNNEESSGWLSSAQNKLNASYLRNCAPLLAQQGDGAVPEDQVVASLLLLKNNMQWVIDDIDRLIASYQTQTILEEKRNKIINFHASAQENDRKTTANPLYFLDFIKENSEDYALFTELTAGKHPVFYAALEQLILATVQQPVSIRLASALSTFANPVIQTYRKILPQMLQNTVNTVASYIPLANTLDSQCKQLFQTSLVRCQSDLTKEINTEKQKISETVQRLFGQEPFSMPEEDPVNMLTLLKERNVELIETLKKYQEWFDLLQKHQAILREYAAYFQDLDHYFQKHNTLWVRFTNFLAQFFSLFKTNTALFLDEVTTHQKKVDEVIRKQMNIIEQQETQLNESRLLPEELKTQLKTQFHHDEAKRIDHHVQRIPCTSQPDVRLLMRNLSTLGMFAHQSESNAPRAEENTSEEENTNSTDGLSGFPRL